MSNTSAKETEALRKVVARLHTVIGVIASGKDWTKDSIVRYAKDEHADTVEKLAQLALMPRDSTQ